MEELQCKWRMNTDSTCLTVDTPIIFLIKSIFFLSKSVLDGFIQVLCIEKCVRLFNYIAIISDDSDHDWLSVVSTAAYQSFRSRTFQKGLLVLLPRHGKCPIFQPTDIHCYYLLCHHHDEWDWKNNRLIPVNWLLLVPRTLSD